MTEAEWLACTDPAEMLYGLGIYDLDGSRANSRKLRLFAVGCCRRLLSLLTDKRSRTAVEIAEKYADGLAIPEQLARAREEADAVTRTERGAMTQEELEDLPESFASAVAWAVTHPDAGTAAESTAGKAAELARWLADLAAEMEGLGYSDSFAADAAVAAQAGKRTVQISLLRDLFDNLFRPTTVNPAWLTCNDGTVRKIAQSIYDERAFDRLPILADALTDAGCDNADILNHCRSEGPHVKGCWVVDALLGKE